MFKKIQIVVVATTFIASTIFAGNMPFPQSKSYGIKPSGSATSNAAACLAQYKIYTDKYLKSNGGKYYIHSKDTDGGKYVETVSEAHGYAMIIMAIMDGADVSTKAYFDGMVKFYDDYKSSTGIMDWRIWDDFSSDNGGATDGDLDIAYAFLLAYEQWGDESYLTAAQKILAAIWDEEINSSTKLPRIDNGGTQISITRPSDWMAGHFRVFYDYDNGSAWTSAAAAVYSNYKTFVSNYSSSTGLISDFISNGAPYSGIETANDVNYYFNACRVPLRFAMDYATSGSNDANSALDKIGGWLDTECGGNVDSIKTGYTLAGTAIGNYNSLEFMAPFGAGLIATDKQALMDAIWAEIQQDYNHIDPGSDTASAFAEALTTISMLVMTGNWWKPGDVNTNVPIFVDTAGVIIDNFSDDYGDDPSQSYLGAVNGVSWGDTEYGTYGGDTTFGKGGSYWYVYGDGGTVKSSTGLVLNDNNMDSLVTDYRMDVTLDVAKGDATEYGYAAIEVPLISTVSKDTAIDRYVDLSKMTNITIKYKSTFPVRFVLQTKDELAGVPADKDGWIGNYGYELPAQPDYKYKTINDSDLTAETDSPLADSVKNASSRWGWFVSGAKNVMAINFVLGEDLDNGASAHLQIEEIIFNGMKYSDFGVNWRAPHNVAVIPFIANSLKKNWSPITTSAGLGVKFSASKVTDIKAGLFNVSGRKISEISAKSSIGSNKINFNVNNLSSGVYVVRFVMDGVVSSSRVSILK